MQTDFELSYFCKNIRYLRKKYKLSKSKMANLLGISTNMLRQLERGIIPLKLQYTILVNIYDLFHIPPDAMFRPIEE